MIDERDRTISVALRPLRDELPPADWGGVLALAQAPAQPEEGAWVDGAVPVAAERPRRRSVRIGALVVVAALALAVVVAGLQGSRSPRADTSGSAATTPAPAKTDFRAAFSQIFARPPSTDPKVLELTSGVAEHLPGGTKVDVGGPREMPSDLGSPLYMVAGSKYVCFVGRSTGAGCTRLKDAADPAHPVALARQCRRRHAGDGGSRARHGRVDERADGRSEDGRPEGRRQRGHRSPRRSTRARPDDAP